jgi:hypothetical protein
VRYLHRFWKAQFLLPLVAILVVSCAEPLNRPEGEKSNLLFADASGMIGQRVVIKGYMRYELENRNLFPPENAKNGIKEKSCLPVLIDSQKNVLIDAAKRLNGSVVIISGVIVKVAPPGMVSVTTCKSVGIDVDSIKGA